MKTRRCRLTLVKLQSYCSSHFGYNPADVMDITQSLRETHKAITYNRSDCQYLSEEHFKEAPKTLAQVVQNIKFKPSELDRQFTQSVLMIKISPHILRLFRQITRLI